MSCQSLTMTIEYCHIHQTAPLHIIQSYKLYDSKDDRSNDLVQENNPHINDLEKRIGDRLVCRFVFEKEYSTYSPISLMLVNGKRNLKAPVKRIVSNVKEIKLANSRELGVCGFFMRGWRIWISADLNNFFWRRLMIWWFRLWKQWLIQCAILKRWKRLVKKGLRGLGP